MLTAFSLPPSTVPRFFIRFNLQTIVKLVQTAEQIDNGH
jgi:hypothetical protein